MRAIRLALFTLLLMSMSCITYGAAAITFSPQGEVDKVEQVRITFPAAMIPLGNRFAAAPVDWSCQAKDRETDLTLQKKQKYNLSGDAYWADEKTWVFDIKQELTARITCRFTIRKNLTAIDGQTFAPQTYTFQMAGARIVSTWPSEYENVAEDQAFVLKFNASPPATLPIYCTSSRLGERLPIRLVEDAERNILIKHFQLEKEQQRVVAFRCAGRFPADSKVTLIYPRGQSSTQRFQFLVAPRFTAKASCQKENSKAACTPLLPITLNFSVPVDTNIAAGIRLLVKQGEKVIERSPDGLSLPFKKMDATLSNVQFSPPFPPLSELTIVLPKNFVDGDQRKLENQHQFPLKLLTAPYPPLAKFAAAPFGIIEAGDDAALPITVRGIEREPTASTASEKNNLRSQFSSRLLNLTGDKEIMDWLYKVINYHENAIAQGKDAAGHTRLVETRRLSLLDNIPQARSFSLPVSNAVANSSPTTDKDTSTERWPFEVLGIPIHTPGLTVVEVKSQILGRALLAEDMPMYVRTAALVTNLAVHFKYSRENAAVWVTTLDKGRPVASAQVRIYNCNQNLIWQGTTNEKGVAQIEEALREPSCSNESLNGFFIIARAKDTRGREDISFVRSTWNQGIEAWRFPYPTNINEQAHLLAHTILDRSLLRAGETLSMKHLMRVQIAQGLKNLDAEQLAQKLRIVHEASGQEFVIPLTWRNGPYAESQFVIPKQAKLGEYILYLERQGKRTSDDTEQAARPDLDGYVLESGRFRVEEFKLPLMRGMMSVPVAAPIAASELPLSVSLMWGNGGAAKNWPTEVSAMLRSRYDIPRDYEHFDFNPPTDTSENIEGKVVLNKATLTLDNNGNGKINIRDLPRVTRPYDLLTEVTYHDPNGKMQTLSKTITLWPAAVRIGINVDQWLSKEKGINLKIIALGLNGKAIANQSIQVRLRKRDYLSTRKRIVGGFYAWETNETVADQGIVCEGKTDSSGYLFCDELRPQGSGNFEFIASAKDSQGNQVETMQSVWFNQQEEVWFDADNHDRIDVIPEKPNYAPGETARLQVRMPFRRATAWLGIERAGIMETRVVELNGRYPVIDLKIEKNWAPNVYVSVLAIRGRVNEVPWYSFFTWGWKSPIVWWRAFWKEGKEQPPPTATVDLAKPAFKYGIAELRIGEEANQLKVEVTPDKKNYKVREVATVDITVKLPNGKPAPAGTEVTFAAVDEGLLELQPNGSWNLLQAMYKRQSYGVETATAQSEVVGKRHYGRKALPPGGGGGRALTRELLDTLLSWQPRVLLDKNGQARIKVPLNDSLSRFRLVAVVDSGAQWFGTASNSLNIVQDVQISAGLPMFVRAGDQLQAMITLRNGTDSGTESGDTQGAAQHAASKGRVLTLKVTAQASGLAALSPQIITLPPGEARQVMWPINVPSNESALRWLFHAEEIVSDKGDAISAKKNVQRAEDKLAITQQVEPAVPLTVLQASLQRVMAGTTVNVPLSLPQEAIDRRGGIRVNFQGQLSQSLPVVKKWFESYPYQCLEQRTSVALGLNDQERWQRLMQELPLYLDQAGLASYFPTNEASGDQGSDVLTSYLLTVAYEMAYAIPASEQQRMLDGLKAFVEGRVKRVLSFSSQDMTARQLAAMAALARYKALQPSMLDVLDKQMTQWRVGMLADWVTILLHSPDLPKRDSYLQDAQSLLRSRLTYQGQRLILNSEDNMNAWWLMSNSHVDAAKLLLAVRQLPQWRDDMPRLLIGLLARQQQGHWQTTTANLWGKIAVTHFAKQFEAVTVSGTSTAQIDKEKYTVKWEQGVPSSVSETLPWPTQRVGQLNLNHMGAGAPWVNVQAEAAVKLTAPQAAGYSVRKVVMPLSQKKSEQFQVGDIVKVTLHIRAQADMTWVVVNDPIPAGASILGDGLGRDSLIGQHNSSPSDTAQASSVAYADFVERRAQAYIAYFKELPRGDFTVEYTMRLNTVGHFNLPATRVEAMYAPEVFGMSPNKAFEILSVKE